MELLFYSQLGKLSVEYLQFKTITNIEYVTKFQQDNLFISIVIDIFELDFEYIRLYFGIENKEENHFDVNFSIHYKDSPERKCLSSYQLSSTKWILVYDNDKKFDPGELVAIQFICYNITFNHIMDKNLFHDNYLSDRIDIQLKQFINSNIYSIGYLVSQKIDKDPFSLKPVLTYQLNNVSYDQDNILVSIISV